MMHLLSADDVSKEEISRIYELADEISRGKSTISMKEDAVLALLFQKPSTRTRVSLEAAMARLGGKSIYIDASTSQLSRGEPISDTAKVLSSYVDFIAARLFKQEDLLELADHSSVPVINALTDLEHPTQAISDVYTMKKAKGKLRGLRIAFLGDIAQNTANSLMIIGAKMGAEFALIGPKGFSPNPTYLSHAREHGVVDLYNDVQEGLEDVDIVYTDTFVSMGNEAEAEKRRAMFKEYQVNAKLLGYAKKDALVMHPLPAYRGQEITADVIDGPRSIVWEQAKNKMLISQAILLCLSEKTL